ERLLAYLSKILGEPVAAGAQVALSSTQRVQLVSWLNSNGIATDINRFKSNLIRIDQILAGTESPAVSAAPAASPTAPKRTTPPKKYAVASAPAPLGLGIDIQPRSKMPETSDFRADAFYKRNFTGHELAHCIEKADPLESLAGIWAAKEAILKAGAATQSDTGELAGIEVIHDASGAPAFPGCLLSISHEAGLAVAVCIRCG
ncbi:holo-ACP synthase, partial [Sphingorhabdus sp.]